MATGPKKTRNSLFALQARKVNSDNDTLAFSLLRAASFHMRGPKSRRIINWIQPELAARLLDCSETRLPQMDRALTAFLSPSQQRLRGAALDSLTENGTRYQFEYRLEQADGGEIWLSETGERASGDGPEATHIVATLRDITDEKRQANNYLDALNTEPVTGFMSQTYFEDIMGYLAKSLNEPKIINIATTNMNDILSVYGPRAASYLVKSISNRIRGELTPSDLASFDGQRVFQIYAPGCSAAELLNRSKKLRYILDTLPFESPYGHLHPISKIGIDTFSDKGGRSKDFWMEKPISRPANTTRSVITELDILAALDQNRFELALQPICRSGSRKVEYHEALLRIRNEDGSLSSAFPYISAAENFGMVAALDLRAIGFAKMIFRKEKNLRLSVNISVGTLTDEKAFGAYLAEVESMGENAGRLMVELTETMALDNIAIANLFAAKLQACGVALAIDDFGAGHTSFKNLLGLEASSIKIDGRYIRNIASSVEKQNFVRLLAEMADVFGLSSVAEMIDNEADARTVERLGVHYLQGFYLGRPKPFSN